MMNKFAHSLNIIRGTREKTDTAVLFYSAGGKDSIVLLDMLAAEFPKIILYFMYLVRGLRHNEIYLTWAAERYNAEIRRIPHWSNDVIRKNGFFCDPVPDIKVRSTGDVEKAVREETGIRYAFSGMKGVDGYMKRMRLKFYAKTGYVSDKGMVYPLALWTNKEALSYIRNRKLITPFRYAEGGVSQGAALNLETLLCLRQQFPDDYEKVLNEFPYADKLIWDYENKASRKARITA
jgi:sulfate adenylyltransferase subunit 2